MKGARSFSAVPRNSATLPMVELLEARKLLSADLTAAFSSLPGMLPNNGSDEVAIQLTNTGASAARGPVSFDLFASADGSLGPNATLLSSMVEPLRLKAAKSVLVPLQFASPASLPAGTYYLAATVTGSGIASNSIVSTGPITIVPAFVDLTSQIVQLPASAGGSGSPLSRLTVEVTNQGNVTASGKVATEVYLSVDGQLDETAIPLTVSLPRQVHLAPGGSTEISVRVPALPGAGSGQYYLLARVNPVQGIVDRDLTNNVSAATYPVQVVRVPHRHRWDCYLLGASGNSDQYVDTGDNGDDGATNVCNVPPQDTSADTAPTTDATTIPTTDQTTQGCDPSTDDSSTDSTPDPDSQPTTDPTDSDGSSDDTGDSGISDAGSSDDGTSDDGSSDSGSDDSGGDSGGDSTDDGF